MDKISLGKSAQRQNIEELKDKQKHLEKKGRRYQSISDKKDGNKNENHEYMENMFDEIEKEANKIQDEIENRNKEIEAKFDKEVLRQNSRNFD